MKKVSVSFFNSTNIEDDLINLCSTDTDYIHVDVGDGKFIERKFNPIKELSSLNGALTKRLDVHFMVEDPTDYIKSYSELNCEYITFHCEIKKDILSLLELIKKYGIKCGLSISPDTDLSFLEPYLDDIDMVLVMSVVPGKGGQSFIYSSVDRVKELKKMIGDRNIVISIDGGINADTSKLVDTDIVVSGSFVLNSDDLDNSINVLR
ncbi:MAG: ribulose-phosphate 3-epimerase [Bacilli bacterium]|nr:ribulose-phosphate 3-epimerase [Bacilli bacterium]